MKALRILFIFSFVNFLALSSQAQNSEKQLKQVFNDAEYFLLSEDYKQALSSYLLLYTEMPENANVNYRIGWCYININGRKDRAIPYLEFAVQHISTSYTEGSFKETKAPYHSLFLLASAYHINNQFNKAIESYESYKEYLRVRDVYTIDYVNKQIESCEYARNAMLEPLRVKTVLQDEVVPQRLPNLNAIVSLDNQVMVYLTEEKFYDAVWAVRKTEDENWGIPYNITAEVGSDGDCYPVSLSPDGSELYLVMMNNYGADIYLSRYEEGKWKLMEKLDKPINTNRFWETHACMAGDGKTLYFTSNRKGGFGGMDIYKSIRQEDGSWSNPVNLGNSINTPYSEETPFITADDKVLYFSSKGHEGMGGYDIYKSELQENGSWSVPINLSYPLNTTDDNLFFFPLEEGKKFLYSGLVLHNDKPDAVKIVIIDPPIEIPTLNLTGKLIPEDGDVLSDKTLMLLVNMETGKADTIHANPKSNSFKIEVQPGNYSLLTHSEGYAKNEKILSIPNNYPRSELRVNIPLKPDEVASGEYFVIKNILFDFDSYELNQDAKLEIERLFNLMKRYPGLFVEVTGHTDSKGSPLYNLQLSKKRANAVVAYLVEKGIDRLRFVSKGLGETRNIAMNTKPDGSDHPEGRKINRNVQIKIVKSDKNIVIEPEPIPDYLRPPKSATYTIYLMSSKTEVPDQNFEALQRVTQESVAKKFSNSVYYYSVGSFFSETQAKEVLNTHPFKSFPEAKIIDSEDIKYISRSTVKTLNTEGSRFSIQIYALTNPVDKNEFSELPDLKVIQSSDGIYRVLSGQYNTYQEAVLHLPDIQNKGYSDAFVVSEDQLTPTPHTEEHKVEKTSDVVYTIQLMAIKTRVAANYFLPLKNILEIEGDDQIFRYVYGEFNNLNDANTELENIKQKGYKNAYVRRLNSIPGF